MKMQSLYGYFRIRITPREGRFLMRSNNERAFILSQLQDALSPRLLINSTPAYKQLASCIDLLAFSIRSASIELIVFGIDRHIVSDFTVHICTQLEAYQSTYQTPPEPRVTIERLLGPHEALAHSITLHHLHEDWEYDRYSSIGFYLHDRRGDWMRVWRLRRLYDTPENYLSLMTGSLQGTKIPIQATLPFLAS